MKRTMIGLVACLCAGMFSLSTGHGDEPVSKAKSRPGTARSKGLAALGLSRTGQSRYGWTWLAGRFDENRDDEVSAEEMAAAPDIFVRLDRNWDGRLNATDFDWSPSNDLGRQREATFALFKALDEDSDGRLTSEEWQASFARIAGERGFLNDENLEQLIYRPLAQRNRAMSQQNFKEQSNIYDWAKPAPAAGDMAPDFELRTPSGDSTVKLSSFRNQKPVVLIFGSFT